MQKTYTIRYLEKYIVSNSKKRDIFAKAIIKYIYRFCTIIKQLKKKDKLSKYT